MRLGQHAVTLALVAAAGAVGVYLYVVDRGSITTSEAEQRKRDWLPAFRREQVSRVEVERGAERYTLARRDADAGEAPFHLLVAGRDEPADLPAVERLLGALEAARPERRVEAGLDRAGAGLAAPRLRLTLTMGKVVYRLAVGGAAPTPAGAAYGELDASGVVVVARDLAAQLDLAADAYRARSLVPYPPSELAAFALDGPGGARRFSRAAWGGWKLEGPELRVDRDAFDRVLTAFADLRADSFLPDGDADAALAKDHVTLRVEPRDAGRPRAAFDVGGACPGHPDAVVAIRREPSRVSACVPKGALAALATPAEALLDAHAFTLHADEIDEVKIVEGARSLELARHGTAWHLRAPAEAQVDGEAGTAVAKALHELASERAPTRGDAAALGLVPPRALVTLTRSGEDPAHPSATETLELGAEREGVVWARRVADGALLALPSEAARELAPTTTALRSRKVCDEKPGDVRAVSVELDGARQTLARSATGQWTMSLPAGFAPDPGLAGDLADALASLAAERWVADADDGSFGLASPRGTLTLELAAADGGVARTLRVVIGGAATGGAYARRDGDAAVFVLPSAVLRRATRLAIDRSYLWLDPAELDLLRATAGARSRELVRRAGALDARTPAARGPWVEALRSKLGELRAEGVVHLGATRANEGLATPRLVLLAERHAPPPGVPARVRIAFGAGDTWEGTRVVYARRDDLDATFVVAESAFRTLLDAL